MAFLPKGQALFLIFFKLGRFSVFLSPDARKPNKRSSPSMIATVQPGENPGNVAGCKKLKYNLRSKEHFYF